MPDKLNILFAGETCFYTSTEFKGLDQFSETFYAESGQMMRKLFTDLGHDFTHVFCHRVPLDFPQTLEALQAFDVILFSDIGANTLLLPPNTARLHKRSPNPLKLVQEYVQNGGGFGMIGGYMTFMGFEAKGHYKGTVIEDILPVNLLTYDDRVETPEGTDIVCAPDSHPILKGIPAEWPYILGYNRLIAKDGATVVVQHDVDPIVSVWEYGKGRTMAYATDCTPHWAPASINQWENYPTLWNNIVHWLAKRS